MFSNVANRNLSAYSNAHTLGSSKSASSSQQAAPATFGAHLEQAFHQVGSQDDSINSMMQAWKSCRR